MTLTLQQHFNLIKEGKGNKSQFLRHAKQLFPQYFNQYTNFDTATQVLKSKQIISEAAGGVVGKGFDIWDWKKILAEETKAVEKETSKEVLDNQSNAYDNKNTKNADNVNFNEIMKGFYVELKDPKNAEKTGDELKDMVVKNLSKDPLYYTKNGEFGVKDLGYTTETPGLGEPKEPKGKYKSSGYGDIEKEIKVKANVQDSLGDKEAKTSMPKKVKEMPDKGVTGAEKKMKLQEGNLGHNETWSLEPEGRFWILTYSTMDGKKEKTFDSEDEAKKWIKQNLSEQTLRSLIHNIIKEELEEAFIDPSGELQDFSSEENKYDIKSFINDIKEKLEYMGIPEVNSFIKNNIKSIKEYYDIMMESNTLYDFTPEEFKVHAGALVDSLVRKAATLNEFTDNEFVGSGEREESTMINTIVKKYPQYSKEKLSKLSSKKLNALFDKLILNEYGEDSGGQDMTWGMYKDKPSKTLGTNQDFINKGKEDYHDGVSRDNCPYEKGYNKYYNADLAKLWEKGWLQASAETDPEFEGWDEDDDIQRSDDDQSRDYDEANLNEYESTIKKGDILYHENSGATLEVIDVKPKTIAMKVTKIEEKTPKYIKVGQISKTGHANIGKTYIKK